MKTTEERLAKGKAGLAFLRKRKKETWLIESKRKKKVRRETQLADIPVIFSSSSSFSVHHFFCVEAAFGYACPKLRVRNRNGVRVHSEATVTLDLCGPKMHVAIFLSYRGALSVET